jgi:hypothetical protein
MFKYLNFGGRLAIFGLLQLGQIKNFKMNDGIKSTVIDFDFKITDHLELVLKSLVDSSCKKTLCIGNSTFMALDISHLKLL